MNTAPPQISRTAIDVRDGCIATGDKELLKDLEVRLPNFGVTVILGPSGTGKSSLMQALAGVLPHDRPTISGTWRRAVSRIAFLPQTRRPVDAPDNVSICDRPQQAMQTEADAVMLDEPDRQVMPADREALVADIKRCARRCLVVVVTHDLKLAREVADFVVFVCAGRIRHSCDAAEFFEAPPSHLAGQFLRQGNCWPKAEEPELPPHFRWLVPGSLGGMGRPGLMRDLEEDLGAIAAHGVTQLVSLEEEALPISALRSFGLQLRHFPIKDMGVPALGPTARLCSFLQSQLDAGGVVAVHCRAGLGRTGTVLASMLVWQGEDPNRAIERVREVQPMALQTRAQEAFVVRFAVDNGFRQNPKSEVG